MRAINVSCAIIIKNKKILVAQRSEAMFLPLKWEFPGGKINDGETEEECIHREIREELNITINIESKLQLFEYEYPEFKVILRPFIASTEDKKIHLLEHSRVRWFNREDLDNLDWAPADIQVVEALVKLFGSNQL